MTWAVREVWMLDLSYSVMAADVITAVILALNPKPPSGTYTIVILLRKLFSFSATPTLLEYANHSSLLSTRGRFGSKTGQQTCPVLP